MSETSETFVHPQDVFSQGSTRANLITIPSSVLLTPDESEKEQLDTSSSSLFGSEDMEQAFREYYAQFVSTVVAALMSKYINGSGQKMYLLPTQLKILKKDALI